MKLLKNVIIFAISTIAIVSFSVAQASTITTTSDTVSAGSPATINLVWDDGGAGNYRSVATDLQFDAAVLTSFNLDACPAAGYTTDDGYIAANCTDQGGGVIRAGWARISGGTPSGTLGTIVFQTDPNATPGDYQISFLSVTVDQAPPTQVVGMVTILPPPAPSYASAPTPAQGVDLGSILQNTTNPAANVAISNTGEVGTTLTGECSITSNPGVFSVTNGAFSVAQGAAAAQVTVACNSTNPLGAQAGTMECTHNGDANGESSPASYALSCLILDNSPAYGSDPAAGTALAFNATNQDDPIADQTVSISNIGIDGTTLSGMCSITGDPQITLAGGAFALAVGAASSVQTVSCDSTAEGDYSATLSCAHNGSNLGTPVEYAVSCTVGPQRPADFDSNVANGATVDITGGTGVAAGTTPAPSSVLQLSNIAASGAMDLAISCAALGDLEISVAPDLSGGTTIAAGDTAPVTFTCDTAAPGSFSTDYTCDYIEDGGEASTGTETYTYTCEVREAMSVVEPNPVSGTELTGEADSGGSVTLSVDFSETADEGVNGSVDCSLADGTNFMIDTLLPADVPAGDTLTVSVTGTDPGTDVDSITDTLNCTYTDTDNPEGLDVSYPLVVTIGNDEAGFLVTKVFDDGSVHDVEVSISCNDGFLNANTATITSDGVDSFRFIATGFIEGAMDCVISETSVTPGYEPSEPCVFDDVTGGEYTCVLSNLAQDGTFTVNKVWDLSGAMGDTVDQTAIFTIMCSNQITSVEGGTPVITPWQALNGGDYATRELVGDGAIVVTVDTTAGPASCSASEVIETSGVESEDDCSARTIDAGGMSECTFTNTVFFEGIPTLSQYGLALMALLMLGMGMVGFRRYV